MSHSVSARALGVGAVAAAALLVAGCGSSSKPAPSASAPKAATATISGAAISRAADVSGAAKGEKVAYTLTEAVPKLGNITLSGVGTFNRSPAAGQMTLNVAIPGASSLGVEAAVLSNLQLTLVFDQRSVYVKLPSNLAGLAASVTGGKAWLQVDLAKLGANPKLSGISGLLSGQSSPTDPAALLKRLAAASVNGVKDVGSATVNGVSTTEYSADLNLATLTGSLPTGVRAATKQQLAKAEKALGVSELPVDVYIDSANLIRRVTFALTGAKTPVSLQMDFLAYGPQAAPAVPAASETDNLDGLISKLSSGGTAGLSSLFGG